MAFVEQAHVNDIGTIFRVTVYDTTSAGGTTVADISGATTKKFTFKRPDEADVLGGELEVKNLSVLFYARRRH